IETDAAGRSCSVLTYLVPHMTWYSRCAGYDFRYPAEPGREALLTGERRYLLLFPGDVGGLQPSGADRAGYLALAESEPMAVIPDRVTGRPAAEIYRLR
ncbi:MAG: hypothetical protein ACRDG7_08545, partial [Candidatus Limnocylindria bacterium]